MDPFLNPKGTQLNLSKLLIIPRYMYTCAYAKCQMPILLLHSYVYVFYCSNNKNYNFYGANWGSFRCCYRLH